MPVATTSKNGLMSTKIYSLIPKRFELGKYHNSINLGTLTKEYNRCLIHAFAYDPAANLILNYYLYVNTKSADTNISVKLISLGDTDTNYNFYYKDNGDSYTIYLYCKNNFNTDYDFFIFHSEESKIGGAKSGNILLDESFIKIPLGD